MVFLYGGGFKRLVGSPARAWGYSATVEADEVFCHGMKEFWFDHGSRADF